MFDHLRRYHTDQNDKKRSDQCRLIVHKIAAVQHKIKCDSGHLMKIPVVFHVAIYIAGLKKIAMSVFFQYRAALIQIITSFRLCDVSGGVSVHDMHISEGSIFRDIPAYSNKDRAQPHSESYDNKVSSWNNSTGTRPVGHQTCVVHYKRESTTTETPDCWAVNVV